MFLGMEKVSLKYLCFFDGVVVNNIYNIVYRCLQSNFDNDFDCSFIVEYVEL